MSKESAERLQKVLSKAAEATREAAESILKNGLDQYNDKTTEEYDPAMTKMIKTDHKNLFKFALLLEAGEFKKAYNLSQKMDTDNCDEIPENVFDLLKLIGDVLNTY